MRFFTHVLKYILFISIFQLCFTSTTLAAIPTKLIYIPLDDRPVCLKYSVDAVTAAGYQVITPPLNLISSYNSAGDPEGLWLWLQKNSRDATHLIIAADSLIYGGTVPSRTHKLKPDVISERINRLKILKTKFPKLNIYCFSSLMRSPRQSYGGVEPSYYEDYGPDLFRLGELFDQDDMYGYDILVRNEIANIIELMPPEYYNDWFQRRHKNLVAHAQLLDLAREKLFAYYIIGKDDNAKPSQTNLEERKLLKETANISTGYFQILPGIDQLGILLLTRAINDTNHIQPTIYPLYSEGSGARTVPLYTNQSVGESVNNQILAIGGLPAADLYTADLLLAINTPFDGIIRESIYPTNTRFSSPGNKKLAAQIKQLVENDNHIALADIAYSNGSDNGFMNELYKKDNLILSLTAYSGWNTADNSIGSAIALGLLAKKTPLENKNKIIKTRILDDWYYQSNTRLQLKKILGEKSPYIYYLGEEKQKISQLLQENMMEFNKNYPDLKIDHFTAEFPWNRLFEVYVEVIYQNNANQQKVMKKTKN